MKTLDDLNIKDIIFRGCANEEHDQISIFTKILNDIKSNNPLMVELGCCDAYYSIIFNKFFQNKDVSNYCVEISDEFLKLAIKNSEKNSCKNMNFIKAGIGDLNDKSAHVICNGMGDVEKYSFNDFLIKNKIKYIDVLHMDIQGSEVSVLNDIVQNKTYDNIKYMFVSTHHADGKFQETYEKCHDILKNVNKKIYFDNKYQGGVGDGLIVLEFL
jgi:FkbM family methyltransferase